MMKEIKMGDVRDFRNFMGAVIDQKAYDRITGYLADARRHAKILPAAAHADKKGWFVEPTLVETRRLRRTACCARRSSAR